MKLEWKALLGDCNFSDASSGKSSESPRCSSALTSAQMALRSNSINRNPSRFPFIHVSDHSGCDLRISSGVQTALRLISILSEAKPQDLLVIVDIQLRVRISSFSSGEGN